MKIRGKVWKFGDDVDTDVIIPACYLNVSDGEELAKKCFEDARPEFSTNVSQGDILVAGRNFGCGSSREHAPLAIKSAGIGVVVAKSFARIFYRNAFFIGLPLIESEEAVNGLSEGAEVEIDFETGKIENRKTEEVYHSRPTPDFMRDLIKLGGLVNYVREKKFNLR
ncbi:MAG: 3-isopropylmalate dehydratase small subunit [Deltaproteobacteria bacterium]|nr:3-isopropylmalate dehydratase small subunit [Deltaproteobacteria bacterium]